MIIRKLALLCLLGLSANVFAAPYELVQAVTTGPAVIGLPWKATGTPRVFVRVERGKWVPAKFTTQGDALTFKLDPAELGSGNIMLIVNPPQDVVLNDATGPVFSELAIDGKGVKLTGTVDLGKVKVAPAKLRVVVKDAANAVDAAAVQVTLDGRPLPPEAVRVEQADRKQARVAVTLGESEYAAHELVITAADAAPEANQSAVRVKYELLDFGNVALASMGAKVSVDSSFAGYESLKALNDGITTMPGDSCGSEISWASAEVDTDHWAEVTLAKPAEIKEVSVYWAAYTHVSHTPKQFEIQVPEDGGWKALYRSPAEGETVSPVTTARFEPVKVDKFRVFMPKGQGSMSRPNLLWIGEIKAR